MEVIYSLIPGMIVTGLILVGVLIWAVKRGQYDDLEGDAHRILLDDDDKIMKRSAPVRPEDNRNWPDAD